jgi:hypothetical protein
MVLLAKEVYLLMVLKVLKKSKADKVRVASLRWLVDV